MEVNVTDNVTFGGHPGYQIPSGCIPFRFQGVMPWDNPENLVTVETEELADQVKNTVVLPILFLIGGPANVINMAVFYRQGLKERINVCLFALSLSDFLYLLFNMILYGEQIYLQLTTKETYGPVLLFLTNNNLLGFYGFMFVSQILSAIIASERCFCVLQPLRSQTILSTSTTTIIIVITNILMLGCTFLVGPRVRIRCGFDLNTLSTTWLLTDTQFFRDNREVIDAVDVFVFGAGVPVVVIVVVAVTTVVTMVKLRQAAAWRAGTSSSSSSSSSSSRSSVSSAREVALTVMLVYNSIFFVVCVFPITLFRVLILILPEFNPGRRQHNLFFLSLRLIDVITYVNATFNFVIYYTMGSRYRQVFWQILGCKGGSKGGGRMRQSKASNATQAVSVLGTEG